MPTVSAVQAEIEERLRLHLDALSRGDADAALQVFASDAVVRLADAEPLQGRTALREFFERTVATMAFAAADFFTEELYLYDFQAFHFGTYELNVAAFGGGKRTQRGSFAIVWKRQRDGTWRYHRGIMNSTLPRLEANGLH